MSEQQPILAPVQGEDYKLKLVEEKVIHLKELYAERFTYLNNALKLQAAEYERRLEALNHEADQLKSMQDKFIPREVFDRIVDELKKDIKINADWRIKQEGQGAGKNLFTQYIPWLITTALAVILFLLNKK